MARATTRCTLFLHYQRGRRGIFFFFFFILLFFGSTLRLRWIFIESEISFLAPALSSIIKRKISSGGREQILDAALPGIPSGSCRIGVGPIMLQSFATATQLSPRFSCGISTKTLVREEKANFFSFFFFLAKKRIL